MGHPLVSVGNLEILFWVEPPPASFVKKIFLNSLNFKKFIIFYWFVLLQISLELGGAVYPTVSLTNHSCSPNTMRYRLEVDISILIRLEK